MSRPSRGSSEPSIGAAHLEDTAPEVVAAMTAFISAPLVQPTRH